MVFERIDLQSYVNVHDKSYDYYSILLLSYSISSSALGSPDLLLPYSIPALASHNPIILIKTHLYLSTLNIGTPSGSSPHGVRS